METTSMSRSEGARIDTNRNSALSRFPRRASSDICRLFVCFCVKELQCLEVRREVDKYGELL